MNELFIPPSANWYCSNIFECASDGTVVYGSRNNIIIINPRDGSEPADIQRISCAHIEKISGLSLNHASWNDPDKLVATIGEDKYVRLWDLNTLSLKMNHKEHAINENVSLVGVSLVRDRVVSVNEKGLIIIWRLSTNKTKKLIDLFPQKSKVKCMMTCPHANWLTAFGFQDGFIVIADLRKEKVLHKLRNENDIIGLSWCPTPYNIYKTEIGIQIDSILKNKTCFIAKTKTNDVEDVKKIIEEGIPQPDLPTVIEDNVERNLNESNNDESDILDVEIPKYDLENRKQKVYKKVDKTNPWGSITFNDTDTQGTLEGLTEDFSTEDFLKDCELTRSLIFKNTKVNVVEDDNVEEITNKNLNIQDNTYEDVDNNEGKEFPNKRFISETSDKEFLLASVSREGNVNIWRALTDGRQQLYLPTPNKTKKNWDRSKWQSICWAKPDLLLVSTTTNRLYCWNLLPSIDFNKIPSKQAIIEPRLIHQDHNNCIFTITVPYKIYPEIERTVSWDSLNDFYVWTTSKDRWILRTTIGTQRKNLTSYCCFGAGINIIAASPIDPSKVALGVYDGTIKIWDLSNPHTQVITMTKLVDGSQDKIISLDWHPVKENCIAYGTFDGKVAQFTTNSKKKEIFNHYHRTSVYKVQWAPDPEKENEYALYSCSMGNLIYHDGKVLSAEPNIVKINEGRPHTFAWKPDFSILAIGTKEATVILLSNKLEVYETFYMQNKAVQCLAWHPESTVADSDISPYANYLAVSTKETSIFIYNCRKLEEKVTGETSPLIAVLEGYKSSVKWLSWCPQIGGRLVSGAEDVIMVWDVITHTVLSTYKIDRKDTLGCVMWSPLDADLIIVCGKDHTVTIFRITKNPPVKYDSGYNQYITGKKKHIQKSGANEEESESTNSSSPPEKTRNRYILPNISKLQNPEHINAVQICRNILEMSDKKNNHDSENDSSSDESTQQSGKSKQNINIEQLFGSRKDMINLLNYEQQKHIQKENWDLAQNISLWKGDLSESIERALKTGVIEPWLINMAPMVSHELWSKLCFQYAEKLVEDGQALEASSYFVACHQIQKAIDVLCNINCYREALALAKCRLPPEDPLISNIYEKWAHYSIIVGNYELAAQCFIILGKYSDAGIYLNKRPDPEKLELALELARRSNNHDLEVAVNAKLELINQQKKNPDEDTKDAEENKIIKISQSRFDAMLSSLNNAKIDDDKSDSNNTNGD